MNFKNLLLGLSVIVTLCASIALQVMVANVYVNSGAWATFGAFTLSWFIVNRVGVSQFLTRKSTKYGANVALVLFLVLGILIFLNVIAKQHTLRKDLTRSGANTLSEQSVKVLTGLSQEVKATFFSSLGDKERGEDVLKRYSYVSKQFKYEFLDVDRAPTQAAAMGVKRKNTVVLSLGDTSKHVSVTEPTEEQLTNGLIKLLRSNDVSVYFSSGHGEHSLDTQGDAMGYSALKAELEKSGYTVKELNLMNTGKIPDDAAVVIVGGPKTAFFPKELEILGSWLKGGGHAVFAVDLDVEESGLAKGSAQLAELLKPYGVQVMSQMLVDPMSKVANVEPQVLLGFAGTSGHPITKDFPHSAMAANFLFPLTTYLTMTPVPKIEQTSLANTTVQAWAESDWASIKKGHASFDPKEDHQGRMDLALAVETKKPDGEQAPARAPKLAVFANALFATNNLIDKVGNRDLILNAVAWLADEDRFISIRAKEDPDALKQFNNNVVSIILLLTIFLIPLSLVGVGTFVWWRRSKL